MAKGKLSLEEKHKIQLKLSEGKTHADIGKLLGRKEATVSKYVGGELTELYSAMFKSEDEDQEEIEEPKESKEPNISVTIKNQVINRLVHDNSNLTVNKATSLVNKVCRKVTVKVTNPDLLYNACLKNLGAGDMMLTQTQGKKGGIAIMTKSASEKSDEGKANVTPISRTARGAIFKQEDVR